MKIDDADDRMPMRMVLILILEQMRIILMKNFEGIAVGAVESVAWFSDDDSMLMMMSDEML